MSSVSQRHIPLPSTLKSKLREGERILIVSVTLDATRVSLSCDAIRFQRLDAIFFWHK